MLHTKFRGNRPSGSREDFWRVFTIYGHSSHLGHVTWTCEQTFVPPSHGGSTWNLASISPEVSEKKTFENVDRQTYRQQPCHMISLTMSLWLRWAKNCLISPFILAILCYPGFLKAHSLEHNSLFCWINNFSFTWKPKTRGECVGRGWGRGILLCLPWFLIPQRWRNKNSNSYYYVSQGIQKTDLHILTNLTFWAWLISKSMVFTPSLYGTKLWTSI